MPQWPKSEPIEVFDGLTHLGTYRRSAPRAFDVWSASGDTLARAVATEARAVAIIREYSPNPRRGG
jgi:hypothetical protein